MEYRLVHDFHRKYFSVQFSDKLNYFPSILEFNLLIFMYANFRFKSLSEYLYFFQFTRFPDNFSKFIKLKVNFHYHFCYKGQGLLENFS